MIEPHPIGLTNTLLPLGALAAAAAVLPMTLVPRATRSHREVALGIGASGALLVVLGAGMFGLLYALRGVGVGAALAEAPLATAWFLVQRSAGAALVWGPVLALIWLSLAQRVERLRSEDGMRNGGPAE